MHLLCSLNNNVIPVLFISVGIYCDGVKGALTLLTGLQNGVTHLIMSPDGNILHAGYRKVCLMRYFRVYFRMLLKRGKTHSSKFQEGAIQILNI